MGQTTASGLSQSGSAPSSRSARLGSADAKWPRSAGQPTRAVPRGAWQHESKDWRSVFNQFETDIAAVEEKEFHPAFERSASSGRKPQMHLQADQRAVARIIDAAQAQLPGRQYEMRQ